MQVQEPTVTAPAKIQLELKRGVQAIQSSGPTMSVVKIAKRSLQRDLALYPAHVPVS
jgi:hypothetical protein